jgi:hypothetical protein
MKRFFKCKFVRTDEMVVAVETEETGDIAHRVEIPAEVGDSWFGREEFGSMIFEDLDEITEQEACDFFYSGSLEEIPVVPLEEGEEDGDTDR